MNFPSFVSHYCTLPTVLSSRLWKDRGLNPPGIAAGKTTDSKSFKAQRTLHRISTGAWNGPPCPVGSFQRPVSK